MVIEDQQLNSVELELLLPCCIPGLVLPLCTSLSQLVFPRVCLLRGGSIGPECNGRWAPGIGDNHGSLG